MHSKQVRGDRQRTAPPSVLSMTLFAMSSTQEQRTNLSKGDLQGVHRPGVGGLHSQHPKEKKITVGDILEGAGILEVPSQ